MKHLLRFLLLLSLLVYLPACTMPAQPTPTRPSLRLTIQPGLGDPTAVLPPQPTPTLPPPSPTPTPTPLWVAPVTSGDLALLYGDWETALADYQNILDTSLDPALRSAAWLGVGRARLLLGNADGAIETLSNFIQHNPNDPYLADAYYFLGEAYRSRQRYGDAADAYLAALAFGNHVIDAYLYELRGDTLFALGDYTAALTDYRAALQSPQLAENLSLEIKIGRTTAILGDYQAAIAIYDSVYARTSSEYLKAQVDVLKAQAYTFAGQPNEAYIAYLDAVNNFPTVYDAYVALVALVEAGYPVDELQRGKVDYFAGHYGVALAALTRYLNASPLDPASAYYYAGLTLRASGDLPTALERWDIVIQKYPDSAVWDEAYEQKAYTLWAYLGNYAEAEKVLLAFVAAAPAHPRAAEFLYDAARVAERDERLEDAARSWLRLASEYPNTEYTFRAAFLAGIAHYRRGDYPAAQAIFINAQSLAFDVMQRSAATFWIAKCQQAAGDEAAARANWQQAAALDPTGYYSERARDILAGRPPFAPPETFDQAYDTAAERLEAENWLRRTFALPPETDLADLGPLSADPRLARGQTFWRLGLYEQARAEFESLRLSNQSDPANSYRLANYFASLGLYRSAILAARQVLSLAGMDDAATLEAPAYLNRLRFGLYYSELVVPAAQRYDFHPFIIWSLIRQESFFEGFIQSPAGARGLMQIVPTTGEAIAAELNWPPDYTADDLYRPLVSINLGVYYLDRQRDALDGDLYAALAAYNGGPGNAAAWAELAQGDPDLFVEIVRFDETRTYLRSIYEIYTIYRRLYSRSP